MGTRHSRRRVTRRPSITELFDEGTAIDEALRLGVQDALRRHKRLGQRVAVWRDGRAVVLEPDQIPVEAEDGPPPRPVLAGGPGRGKRR